MRTSQGRCNFHDQQITNDGGDEEKDDLVYNRQDFWATSSNKQLNFLQHIFMILEGAWLSKI